MHTFVLRARKGTTQWQNLRTNIGGNEHAEIIAHAIMNAFYVSQDFRRNVEVYIVLDSAPDFPRTIKLSGAEGLSFPGFHEDAILLTLEQALKNSQILAKNEYMTVAPGITVFGHGFEKLISQLHETRPVYLLSPKGDHLRETKLEHNAVYILSDHIPLPNNIIKSFKRRGIKTISLGKRMLFASQCIVLINHEMDFQE